MGHKEPKPALQSMGPGDTGQEADPLSSGDLHDGRNGCAPGEEGGQKGSGVLRREYRRGQGGGVTTVKGVRRSTEGQAARGLRPAVPTCGGLRRKESQEFRVVCAAARVLVSLLLLFGWFLFFLFLF